LQAIIPPGRFSAWADHRLEGFSTRVYKIQELIDGSFARSFLGGTNMFNFYRLTIAFGMLFVASQAQAELIVNGDFSTGNAAFASDYAYVGTYTTPYVGDMTLAPQWPEGTYAIVTDPKDAHPFWDSISDHTGDSTGYMMTVNGDLLPSKIVWTENVTLTAGVTYSFSAWASSVHSPSPAPLNFGFSVGDNSLGSMQLPSSTGWTQFAATYTPETSGPVAITITDMSQVAGGNDFALDDISMSAVPEPATLALLGMGAIGLLVYARRRRG
jgi:hypothetical protein